MDGIYRENEGNKRPLAAIICTCVSQIWIPYVQTWHKTFHSPVLYSDRALYVLSNFQPFKSILPCYPRSCVPEPCLGYLQIPQTRFWVRGKWQAEFDVRPTDTSRPCQRWREAVGGKSTFRHSNVVKASWVSFWEDGFVERSPETLPTARVSCTHTSNLSLRFGYMNSARYSFA
jgi:hypothetical protein